jgi:hypothetical protein
MTDRYQVTIRIEPVFHGGPDAGPSRSPGEGVELNVSGDPAGGQLRITQPEDDKNDVRLEVEIAADSAEEAVQYALTLAQRFIRVEALAEDAMVQLTTGRAVRVRNLTHPDQLHPQAVVKITVYHHSAEAVERAWHQLAGVSDATLRDLFDLALDWLYIGSVSGDARTAFLTYWMALEVLLKVGLPPLVRRKSKTPQWLRSGAARMRAVGIAVSDQELDVFRRMRNALVHEAGAPASAPPIEASEAERLRTILADYVKHLLGTTPSTTGETPAQP